MKFTKMHGLGNDYLYFYGEVPENVRELAVRLSDRHFGAGSDGLIFISRSDTADFRMRIFNADGSEAMMCGNGIRCVGKYVYDKGYIDRKMLTVETLSGIRTLELHTQGGTVKTVTVGMGKALVGEEKRLTVRGKEFTYLPVSIGNPHAVFFTDHVEEVPLSEVGPRIELHPDYPDGVNVEFVERLSDNRLRMRVWERGSGITMACGTGASASAAAAVRKGYADTGQPVRVILDGGPLEIIVNHEGLVTMQGPAETVYEAEIPDEEYRRTGK